MIGFIKALVSLVGGLVGYLNSRQLLDAGSAREIAGQLRKVMDNVDKARAAADAVDPDSPTYDDDYARRVRERYSRD